MAIGSPDKAARLEQLRGYARVQVWSGYADDAQVRREVAEAVRDEVSDEDRVRVLVDEMVEAAHDDLAKAAATWPVETSYDRFQQALRALEQADVVVLEACQDHWSADEELRRRAEAGRQPRGIAYFTPADVWHAVDHEMLELNVWHGNSANVREGDDLITFVQQVLADHGLTTRFDEGRLEVTMAWERRPGTAPDPHAQ